MRRRAAIAGAAGQPAGWHLDNEVVLAGFQPASLGWVKQDRCPRTVRQEQDEACSRARTEPSGANVGGCPERCLRSRCWGRPLLPEKPPDVAVGIVTLCVVVHPGAHADRPITQRPAVYLRDTQWPPASSSHSGPITSIACSARPGVTASSLGSASSGIVTPVRRHA